MICTIFLARDREDYSIVTIPLDKLVYSVKSSMNEMITIHKPVPRTNLDLDYDLRFTNYATAEEKLTAHHFCASHAFFRLEVEATSGYSEIDPRLFKDIVSNRTGANNFF